MKNSESEKSSGQNKEGFTAIALAKFTLDGRQLWLRAPLQLSPTNWLQVAALLMTIVIWLRKKTGFAERDESPAL